MHNLYFYRDTLPKKAEILPRNLAEDVQNRDRVLYGANDPDVLYALRHRVSEPVKVVATR